MPLLIFMEAIATALLQNTFSGLMECFHLKEKQEDETCLCAS